MRDRLIELLRADIGTHCDKYDGCENCPYENDQGGCLDCLAAVTADYLLANGVIVPPCKVGDTVYVRNRANRPQEMIFDTVDLRCTCKNDDACMCGSLCSDKGHCICQYRFKNDFSDFGKTVFLTREEAERALKEVQ